MAKTRSKKYTDVNVYEASLERIRYIYDNFDKVFVSFSGGKDSTAVLNIALQVAKEKNKLPLDVVFHDEEAIHPTTIEYVKRVAAIPEVNLRWFCLEYQHRNACSNEEPFWYTWEKGKEDIWVRELPEGAITEHPKFKKGMSFQEFAQYLYDRSDGRVANLNGIRTQESLRRYAIIAQKKEDSYIQGSSDNKSSQYRCFPIYDWSSEDVWLAVHKYGWDYNKTYDIYNQTTMYGKFLKQRVCPPFGEEPLRGLWVYAECFPELWHKMLYRVPGVATAWRYANTELYSNAKEKPEHLTWREYLNVILETYDYDTRLQVKKTIGGYIKVHQKQSNGRPIPEEETDLFTGFSWKLLCKVAVRGDFKGRQSTIFVSEAKSARKKLGLSLEDVKKMYDK